MSNIVTVLNSKLVCQVRCIGLENYVQVLRQTENVIFLYYLCSSLNTVLGNSKETISTGKSFNQYHFRSKNIGGGHDYHSAI